MAPRKTENNTYAKFWDDKERALCCVMVFAGVGKLLGTNGLCPGGGGGFSKRLDFGGSILKCTEYEWGRNTVKFRK